MSRPFHLFEAFGVELEYMIVDADSLGVRPIADEVLKAFAGEIVDAVELPGGITCSNELVLHVLELKATEPLQRLEGCAAAFQKNVRRSNEILQPMHARLMPSGMHPWMQPDKEMKLWPHECSAIYEAFHHIFDCRGHGWANLQSVHLNLPFADDEEFARLHTAIRFLLPILPALAASSPLVEDRISGFLDTRLEHYRSNSARIPEVAGLVIPEPVQSRREYEQQIFQPIFRAIAPHDPEGVLQEEFLNARGAIARFSRHTIEIRLLDVQECPLADVAICAFLVAVLKLYLEDASSSLRLMRHYPSERLRDQFLQCIRSADQAEVKDQEYPAILGLKRAPRWTAGQLWRALFERVTARNGALGSEFSAPLHLLLDRGPLARRILEALGTRPSRTRIAAVYANLVDCLNSGRQFVSPRTPLPW
jgi:gamma-glutamyl:cysteine ligase YbdK (ATP-grasp superfamily)